MAKQKKAEMKAKKLDRKGKKQLKNASQGEQPKKKKRKGGYTKEDIDEIANDIAMFKKLKRKKISDEEFNKQMGIDDSD